MIVVKNIRKSYKKKEKIILDDVSFTIKKGDCVGLLGESGSGKSTLSRIITGLEKQDEGTIFIDGYSLPKWRKLHRGKMSIVFQNYIASVNPQYKVKEIITEFIDLHDDLDELLQSIGLDPSLKERYPHQLSGGQLQRVCIARAIALRPRILILDEPVSSLDVSIQAEILQLLKKIKTEIEMTIIFITHDLQVATYLCDELMFLYDGKIVEQITTGRIAKVKHPYAKELLKAATHYELF